MTPAGKTVTTVTRRFWKLWRHWRKHRDEFPEYGNLLEYARGTRKLLNDPPAGTRVAKRRRDGATLLYDPETNRFGVKHSDGTSGTMFRPKDGIAYWNRQIRK